jgi:hypothetical protein
MATVRLGRYELEEYDLPRVCMYCGARATHYKSRRFQWFPPWAWLVLGWLGAMIFMKSCTMPAPLCEKHKWHWGGRTAVILLSLLGLIVVVLAGVALGSALDLDPAVVFLPILVLFVGWLVLAVVLSATQIRPTEITDKSITLRGVSEDFVEALEEARRGDDEDRPRRRRARDEDEDDEDDRPRRRRRAADDGGYYDPGRRRRRPSSDTYEEDDDRR